MQDMKVIYQKPDAMTDVPFPYCPGCSHGTVHRLVAEVMDELEITGSAIGVTSAGCSVRSWRQFDCDMVMALHGRGPAVATGIKRARPASVVFTYQGDGDMAAIGTGEIVHAASRCERITVIYVNNGVFGATGGQQAPTTLIGQPTTSYPAGRDPKESGYPLRMAEMPKVETILMRVFEGVGIGGLKGIPRGKTDGIVRPILDVWKEDILENLKKRKIHFRRDKSNDDTRFERNWIRHVLIPLLVKRYGKAVKHAS